MSEFRREEFHFTGKKGPFISTSRGRKREKSSLPYPTEGKETSEKGGNFLTSPGEKHEMKASTKKTGIFLNTHEGGDACFCPEKGKNRGGALTLSFTEKSRDPKGRPSVISTVYRGEERVKGYRNPHSSSML